MCWGEPAMKEAEASMRSLWKKEPDMPVLVVGDGETCDRVAAHFAGREQVSTHKCYVDPFTSQTAFGFKAGRIKPLLAGISPFEQSLYVDAETEFKISPKIGFDLLEHWDFVVAEAEIRSLANSFLDHTEADRTAAWLKTPYILYHNSGMLFWRKNDATAHLFELWASEWLRFKGWDEQVALLRALLKSDALFLNVPFTWNCRGPKGAYLLYHRFASKTARKFQGGRYASPRLEVHTPARSVVRVELAPGRFVKCHAGDEEQVLAHFRQMMAGHRKK